MTGGGTRRGALTWGFLAAAAVLALLYYRDFAFHPGRMLFGTDMVGEGFPLRRFWVDEVRAGRGVPLWNPFVYAGQPYVAILPGPIFYPSTLLYLLLPLYRAIGWTFVLHTFLAGAFGYFAARSFRLDRSAAAVSGLAFMFSGYLLSTLYGGHDGRMFAIVLVPLALGMLERGFRTGTAAWFAGTGVAVGLQILTPHTQLMYFSSLGLALFAAFRLGGIYRGEGEEDGGGGRRPGGGGGRTVPDRVRPLVRPVLLTAGAFLLAAALGAVQLLPTWALLDDVVRSAGERGYEFAASWAMPPQEVTALFLPDLIGSLDGYWGTNPFKLHTEFLGAVPAALSVVAVAGAISGKWPGRRAAVGFLAAAALLGVLFAMGAATPVHRLAYAAVPMIDRFRAPSMMLGPVSAFVALLAGFGWQRFRDARTAGASADRAASSVPWLWILVLSAPFLFLGLAAALTPGGLQDFAYHAWFPAGWERRPAAAQAGALRAGGLFLLAGWLGALGAGWAHASGRGRGRVLLPVLLLLVVDLWRVDVRYLRTAEPEELLSAGPAVERLRTALGPGERVWPVERVFRPNELMYHGIPSVAGSQKFVLSWYSELVGGLSYENLARRPALWPAFDLAALASRSDLAGAGLEPLDVAGPARIYRTGTDLPHAFFPRSVALVADPGTAIERTLSLGDLRELAVVEPPPVGRRGGEEAGSGTGEREPGAGKGGGEAEDEVPAGAGSASVERYAPDEVVLAVRAERRGLLFVSDVWAPGWRASVDGQETPVHRVDGAFRGVVVPEGEHRVVLSYRPVSFRIGLILSLGALVVLASGLGLAAYRRWTGDEV